jgi:hypothetical protein
LAISVLDGNKVDQIAEFLQKHVGHHRSKFLDIESVVLPSRPPRNWRPKLSPEVAPVFLSAQQRTYGNPISYLGGPLVKNIKRASKESVLSLD